MTIPTSNATADLPILASDIRQVFHHVNSTPGFVAFLAPGSGVWAVPEGVHKFRVTLYGAGGAPTDVSMSPAPSWARGEDGVRARTYFTGVDVGTSFNYVVGAGQVYTGGSGAGGASSFGPVFSAPGGRSGQGSAAYREAQAATFPAGLPQLYVAADLFVPFADFYRAYGAGGEADAGLDTVRYNGYPGAVIIEW